MYKQKRKGFTLVELLVVIAILAVLATVSIVGYASFVKKAKISNDTALLKQINDLLIADEAVEGKPATMQDALDVIEENGFLIEKLTPTAQGYNYIWDRETNRFLLLDDKGNAFAPAGAVLNPANSFVIVHNEDEIASKWSGYNYYLAKDFKLEDGNTALTVSTDIDAGMSNNISIVYDNASGTADHTVVIRTNRGNLTVKAPNDTVNHYGDAGIVTVEAIKSDSYHEYGNVVMAYIQSGHLVTEENGYVSKLFVQPAADTLVKLTLKTNSVGTLILPNDHCLTADSVIPEGIPQEIKDVPADKLNVVAGDNPAASLSEAVKTEGGYIELVDNVDVTIDNQTSTESALEIANGAELGLNGNTIEITSENGKNGIKLDTGATATISNGTISQNQGYGSSYAVVDANQGQLTLDNMSIKMESSEESGTCVTAGSDGGKLIIKDSKIEAPTTQGANTVFCGSGSSVVIENSTIKGTINVMGNSTLEIRGGDFTEATFKFGGSGNYTIYGGIFGKNPTEGEKMRIAVSSILTQDGGKWIVTPLSELAPTNVDSAAAFNAALQNTGFVKLTADIALDDGFIVTVPASAQVLLDLNGHVITENSKSTWNIVIAEKGKLIIQDSSEAKMGEIKNTFVGNPGEEGSWGLINNRGTLVINGGKFTNVAHANDAAIRNRDSGTLTINDGTFVSEVDDSDFKGNRLISSNGKLTIKGGTFTMKNTTQVAAIWATDATIENAVITSVDSIAIWSGWYIEIKSGTISGKVAIKISTTIDNGQTDIIIRGGDIKGDDYAVDACGPNSYVTFTGGTVSGALSAEDDATIEIKGGTFDQQPASSFIASGYQATESNGVWTVSK